MKEKEKDKHKVLIDKQIEDFNKIWSDINKPIVVEQFEGADDNKEFIYLIEVSFNKKRRTNLFRYGEEGALTWESVYTHIQHQGGIQGCYETAVNMLRDFDIKYDDEKYPSTLDEVFKPKVLSPEQIAKKYIYWQHSDLTYDKAVEDMVKDINNTIKNYKL